MNEQLRKAIEEATRVEEVEIKNDMNEISYSDLYNKSDVDASQAKLLRVIELLVEQRDAAWRGDDDEFLSNKYKADVKLIAALEEK